MTKIFETLFAFYISFGITYMIIRVIYAALTGKL